MTLTNQRRNWIGAFCLFPLSQGLARHDFVMYVTMNSWSSLHRTTPLPLTQRLLTKSPGRRYQRLHGRTREWTPEGRCSSGRRRFLNGLALHTGLCLASESQGAAGKREGTHRSRCADSLKEPVLSNVSPYAQRYSERIREMALCAFRACVSLKYQTLVLLNGKCWLGSARGVIRWGLK
jgi:hypothetical protein